MNILPEVGQIVEFDLLSIILLIVILISVIVGVVQGLIGSIVSFISSFGSMFFASLFSESLGNLIYSTEFSNVIYNPIYSFISNQGNGIFNNTITAENKDALLGEAFSILNVPEMLHGVLTNLIGEFIPETGANLAEITAQSLTMYACSTIAFIVLWLVIFIVFKLLDAFAKGFNEMPVLGPVNRIFGGVMGLVTGTFICFIICYVLSLVSAFNIEFINEILLSMKLDDPNVWTFSKMVFNNNLIITLIETFINA